jgi:pyruvate/2-oxoglutarate dehydrogenase complex dihydrolipoamide dehydrogenase (E3) component
VQRHEYDLVVVGGGSAGYAAARTARDAGARVAIVDRGPLGGLCILRGCMPSKALLASSDALADARSAHVLGLRIPSVDPDMPFIAARKRALVHEFAADRIAALRGFPLYEGPARFLSHTELQVGSDVVLAAPRFVIATGSVIAPPVIPGLRDAGYLDSDAALDVERIPSSLVVLGGGYVACELGQFFARMGARATFVIRGAHLLSGEDDDVGDALTTCFREEGIEVVERAALRCVERRGGTKVVRIEVAGREREIAAEEILYCLGRVPNVEGLDLEKAGVRYHPITGIEVDATLRTSNPSIFAVGDVTGEFLLVHVAIYQGEIAARNAVLGSEERASYDITAAHAVFCDPQVARVGATERELRAVGEPYVSGRYDFADHGKAMCLAKTHGFVKMVASARDGRILGGALIGDRASELIHEVIVAMSYGATVQQFMRIPHLHPTMSEIWTYPAETCAERLLRQQPEAERAVERAG